MTLEPSRVAALTITEAAQAAGVDRRTIRRRLDAGGLPNAYRQDGDGPWVIPITDLLAAGWKLATPPDHEPEPMPSRPPDTDRLALEAEADQLRRELLEANHRAQLAEAKVAAQAESLSDLRLALRMLEAGPVGHLPAIEDTRPSRRWWRGR